MPVTIIVMQVMWQRLYKGGSSLEGGTLQQLRNLINRRNVSASTSIKGHVTEIQDFLELIVKCHIVAVTMHYFSMENIDDKPHTSAFPSNVKSLPPKQKWKLFQNELCQIIDKYVIPKQYVLKENRSESVANPPTGSLTNPHAKRVQDEHSYANVSTANISTHKVRQLPSVISQHIPRSVAAEPIRRIAIDGVFNYASAVLNDGLLLLEFSDAIREGDGVRILHCWKAMLIYFQFGRHSNYAKEAILQAQVPLHVLQNRSPGAEQLVQEVV